MAGRFTDTGVPAMALKWKKFKYGDKLRVTRNGAAFVEHVKRGDIVWFRNPTRPPRYDKYNEYVTVFTTERELKRKSQGCSVAIRLDALIRYKKYQRIPK